MAAATVSSLQSPYPSLKAKTTSIKVLAESGNLTSLPATYVFHKEDGDRSLSEPEVSIPVIDFSLLSSGDPNQRSEVVRNLAQACEEWGFFRVTNHGVPEDLMRNMIEACQGFFDLTEHEKREFEGKHVLDPIRFGTSFNLSVDKVLFWRDFLKVFLHPKFHSPTKPSTFSEISKEYCREIRGMIRKLLEGISESLELEASYIDKAMGLDLGTQILIANLYPPCPEPELAMGLPAHSDHGLLTVLLQNGIDGLQLLHKGKWVDVKSIPTRSWSTQPTNLSNGKYKSVIHRAVVNDKATRISLAIANGPALDTVVTPVPEFVDAEKNPPAYAGMEYKDFIELQQSNQLDNKSCLDRSPFINHPPVDAHLGEWALNVLTEVKAIKLEESSKAQHEHFRPTSDSCACTSLLNTFHLRKN